MIVSRDYLKGDEVMAVSIAHVSRLPNRTILTEVVALVSIAILFFQRVDDLKVARRPTRLLRNGRIHRLRQGEVA